MADFTKVAKVDDIATGTMKTVRVSGKSVAIANFDGQYFAVDDTCSHEQCSLGTEGMLDGSIITCGCHGGQFEVSSGKVLSLPAPTDISSYQVKIEGSDIYVAI